MLNTSSHLRTQLVTAEKAVLNGKRNLQIIDADRESGNIPLKAKEFLLTIDFIDKIDELEVTFINIKYDAPISIKGLGLDIPDIRKIMPVGVKTTYRLTLPTRSSGSLAIASKGGEGVFNLYDISGFIHELPTGV